MLSEPEVYNLKHWRGLPDRSRGSKNAPAFKYKLEFCRYINKAPRLSDATKRIGRAIVEHYNEARGRHREAPGYHGLAARRNTNFGGTLTSFCHPATSEWPNLAIIPPKTHDCGGGSRFL